MNPTLEHWYDALHSRYGVRLRVEGSRQAAKDKLYAERRKAQDPALSRITVTMSPFSEQEIWLVKTGEANGRPQD